MDNLLKTLIVGTAFVSVIGWSSPKAAAAPSSSVPGYNVSLFAANPGTSSAPDSIAISGNNVFVGYGDFHAPDGSDGLNSEIYQYSIGGQILNSFTVPGHNDGLRINPANGQLWALSNEDSNALLIIIDPSTGVQTKYNLPSPAPHGGGYDDLAFLKGQIFISASNPANDPNSAPAVGSITLPASGNNIQVTPVLTGNAQSSDQTTGQTVALNLQDPDSLGITPAGALTLDGQADKQLTTITNPGTSAQQVSNVDLAAEIDDSASAPTGKSFILVADTGSKTNPGGGGVYEIGGNFTPGTTYAAENAAGEVGILNTANGQLSSLATGFVAPHGLAFAAVPEPDQTLGMLAVGAVFIGFKLKGKATLASTKK